jgi:hypothetical protein
VTYTQGYWQNSYCTGTNNCAGSPNSACNLTITAPLPSELQSILDVNCPAGTDTKAEICGCFDFNDDNDNNGADGRNAVAFVFNVLLANIGRPSQPTTPEPCNEATYNPASTVFVCTKPGAEAACPCPTRELSLWGNALDVAEGCYDFVNNAGDNGQCLPALSDKQVNCQLQSCACGPGSSPSPSPEVSPSPSPEVSPSPSPEVSPSPSPEVSPSSSPEVSPSPSPSPSPPAEDPKVCLSSAAPSNRTTVLEARYRMSLTNWDFALILGVSSHMQQA